jgi:hypothetical protein
MLKNLIIVVCVLFTACQNQDAKTKEKDSIEYSGTGCGDVHASRGWITLFNEMDSSTYLLIHLKDKRTTVESGEIVLDASDSTNQVHILDFNTEKKVYETIFTDVKGYVFPCSDIVIDSHAPDTLRLLEGKLNIKIQTIVPNTERIYYIHVENAKFSKGNKIKDVENYRCNIKFTKGNPG